MDPFKENTQRSIIGDNPKKLKIVMVGYFTSEFSNFSKQGRDNSNHYVMFYRKPINRLFYKKGQNPLVIITKAQIPTADA